MITKNILNAAASFAASLALLPAHGQAQGDESIAISDAIDIDDVYRIELVVFADVDAIAAQAAGMAVDIEQWREPDDLSYPKRLVFLRKHAPRIGSETVDLAAGVGGGGDVEPSEDTVIIPPLLTTLEKQQSSLTNTASALQRRSQYRLLYHQTWNQALTDRKQAPAIPVTGGERYDDWFELTGSITFSKERFLHVTTDLWLSEFSYRNEFTEQRPWYQPAAAARNWLPPLPSRSESEDDISAINGGIEYEIDAGANYRAERTYVLREYRRLKRDEIHYLDHPVFGVIVMVSKYQSPADN